MPVEKPSITLQWDGELGVDEVFNVYENDILIASMITINQHEISMKSSQDGNYSYVIRTLHLPSGVLSEPSNAVVTTVKKPEPPTNLRVSWNV